jgi:hypothetical protein
MRGESAGLHAQLIPIYDVVERSPKAAMIVVLKRNETERLQHTISDFPHGSQNFGHAMHRPGLRLKSNFDEVALSQRVGHL